MTHPSKRKLEVTYRKVADLIPYAANSRTHTDGQVALLAGSLKRFGWTNPVLVDGENGIVAGHGRVLAARKLGMEEVPCIELAGMSEADRRAYIIADNRLAELAGWDNELLAAELGVLRELDFPLGEIGFSQRDLEKLFGSEDDGGGDGGGDSYKEQFGVIVMCKDAAHQERVYNELQAAGHECKVVVT